MSDGYDKATRLAGEVLRSAVDQDWRRCERYMARLNSECDSGGLGFAFVAWCDALAEHANDGMPEFERIRIMDVDQDSGAALTDDTRTPQIRWCNRLVAARAAGNKAAFSALLDELNTIGDGMERGRYASALIQAVAGTMRTYPRGYALMGRTS